MTQQATVRRTFDDGTAELTVRRDTACGACHGDHCAECAQAQQLTVRARNPIGATVGDRVTIQHTAPVEGEDNAILDGSSVTLDEAAPASVPEPQPTAAASPAIPETE